MPDYPKFRPATWFCLKTLRAKHGIQGQFGKGLPYCYASEDGVKLLFDSKEERDAKLAELRGRIADGSILFSADMVPA